MASVNRTAYGTWKVLVRCQGWPPQIKTFRLKRDAEDWARETEDAIKRGVYSTKTQELSGKFTLSDALDRYERTVSPTKRASTQDRESVRIKQVRSFFGRYGIAAVTPELVARYRDRRLNAGKSSNTVRLELALLGHLYTTAIREWGFSTLRNPVALITKPSPGPGRTRRLTQDEETRLLEACRTHSNPMLAWIVETALCTGMRQGEVLTLRIGQVDMGRRVIRLEQTKNGTHRTVPLSRRAMAALEMALKNPIRPPTTDLVFFGEPGKDGVRRPYVIGKIWQQALVRAGIRDLHFHDLRHEAASRLVERGLSDQEVAAITGHKSMQMLKRYTHLRAEDLVKKLD